MMNEAWHETWGELIARKAREPSTWKGVGWLLVAAGVVPVGSVEAIAAAGVAIVGLTEVARRES